MTRDELIAALEAATGPGRELDWGIHEWVWGVAAPRMERMEPPSYTASIDAALTLVPEEWGWHTDHTVPDSVDWVVLPFARGDKREAKGRSAVAAIALCIAALKARAP